MPPQWLCFNCKGASGQARASGRSQSCTANACKLALKALRAQQPATSQHGAAAEPVEDEMPRGMSVDEILEILGERCCQPHQMDYKKRKNGPGSSYRQQVLVRGMFLEADGDESEPDEVPAANTYWVDMDDLLTPCEAKSIETALLARHDDVLACLPR